MLDKDATFLGQLKWLKLATSIALE